MSGIHFDFPFCVVAFEPSIDNFDRFVGSALWHMLAVNHYGWAALELLEAETCSNVEPVFQPLLFCMAQHRVQHFLRALEITISPKAHAHFDLVRIVRVHQRERFAHDSVPALVSRMQEVMCLFSADV